MFGLSPMEMMVIGVIAVLLFGKRLPEVGRSLGKGMTEFKKGLNGIQTEIMNPGSTPVKPSGYRARRLRRTDRAAVRAPDRARCGLRQRLHARTWLRAEERRQAVRRAGRNKITPHTTQQTKQRAGDASPPVLCAAAGQGQLGVLH
ncbi:MAG: twin-arginine translocase TatA/TatE family subunit [Pirellulales bacterium]